MTQGTIFSNARSSHFSTNVYGLIISARCDMANPHYDSFMYVPVIDLKTWFYGMALPKTCQSMILNKTKNIENKFEEKKLALESLKYVDKYKLLTAHFNKNECTVLMKEFDDIEFYNKIVNEDFEARKFDFSLITNKKSYYQEINSLLDNNYNGYFYLENIDYYDQANERGNHFVAILNEVEMLPANIKQKILDGLDLTLESEYQQYFGPDSAVLALSIVNSPYIEYIIQYFTSLFRVGIDRAEIKDFDFLIK
jgi:hypothetical protein